MSLKHFCEALILCAVIGWVGTSRAAVTGQWLFDEGTGTSALDTSGFLRNGVEINGPTYVSPGLYKNSNFGLKFTSASTQKVTLPAATDFIRNAPGATLMGWVQLDPAQTQTGTRTILSIFNADATGNAGDGNARATIQVIASGTSSVARALGREVDTGGSANAAAAVANAMTPGQNYFLAGVFDYANNVITLYQNGVQVAQNTAPANWTAATTSSDSANLVAGIGTVASANATQEYFSGILDGVRVFNTAFTATDIQNIYNAEVVPEPATLVLAAVGGLALVFAAGRRHSRAPA